MHEAILQSIRDAFPDSGFINAQLPTITFREAPDVKDDVDVQGSVVSYVPTASKDKVLEAVGKVLFGKLSETSKTKWTKMLVLPKADLMPPIQMALEQSPAKTYREIVLQLTNPMQRMAAIHCFNALIASRVSRESARNLKLESWPSTEAYYRCSREHSLLPLVSRLNPDLDMFCNCFRFFIVGDIAENDPNFAVYKELFDLFNGLATNG
jgi:hypothetical protein